MRNRRPAARLTSAVLCLALVTAPALGRANPQLKRGMTLVNEFEERKALEVLKRALSWPENTDSLRAQIYLYRDIAFFELLDKDSAAKELGLALEKDPKLTLPASVSPKLKTLFEELQKRMPRSTGEPKTVTVPKSSNGQQGETPKPEPIKRKTRPVEPDPPPPKPINWPAWVCLGIAVAAGGAGLGLGLSAKAQEEEYLDLSKSYEAAKELRDRAAGRALGANVLFGIAGAAAIASAVFMILGYTRNESTLASVSPIKGGAVFQLSGLAW
jgi:tetratricopeptide (TPR) repeat protein